MPKGRRQSHSGCSLHGRSTNPIVFLFPGIVRKSASQFAEITRSGGILRWYRTEFFCLVGFKPKLRQNFLNLDQPPLRTVSVSVFSVSSLVFYCPLTLALITCFLNRASNFARASCCSFSFLPASAESRKEKYSQKLFFPRSLTHSARFPTLVLGTFVIKSAVQAAMKSARQFGQISDRPTLSLPSNPLPQT